jgi:hypothetical protein
VHLHLSFLRNLQRVVSLHAEYFTVAEASRNHNPTIEAAGARPIDHRNAWISPSATAFSAVRWTLWAVPSMAGRCPSPIDGAPLRSPPRPSPRGFFVDRSLLRGSKTVDTMIPIGEGERRLIIGDAETGRNALALDTLITKKGRDFLCVYVPAAIRHWD